MVGTGETSETKGERTQWLSNSLFLCAGIYEQRPNGEWRYKGERPAPGWHGHGYFSRKLTVLQNGHPIQITVNKHRWRLDGTNTTCHSRAEDDLPLIRYCTLIIVLRLWAWSDATVGFHHRREVHDDLLYAGSDRTVQRWMQRAQIFSLDTQQAIRLCVLERSEPRPMERLFEGGLSPPKGYMIVRSQNPSAAEALWRAFAMLICTTREYGVNASILLAEAKRRCSRPKDSFLI
jgi:hypothetical protein